MAQIQDRKSDFYSKKQSIRDELSAPQYLESAGENLIKYLAKKQTNTSTSLREQLDVVQNFEEGFKFNPDDRKGISSLEEFKKHAGLEQENSSSLVKKEGNWDLNELLKITGLSRHELELSLCEKPTSKVSQLYLFAIGNKIVKKKCESLEDKLCSHPINHLKEIEEECFGHLKKPKLECETPEKNVTQEKGKKSEKKKKPRKRKKKIQKTPPCDLKTVEPRGSPVEEKNEETPRVSPSRPSLWDIKDMKKWSECKKVGCKPQAFYTIKNGKIIKLEKEASMEDTT